MPILAKYNIQRITLIRIQDKSYLKCVREMSKGQGTWVIP